MPSKNRRGVKYPRKFMKIMKRIKNSEIRRIPIDQVIVEKGMNTAERVL